MPFFSRLYFYEGDDGLDLKGILPSLEEQIKDMAFPFEDVSEAYQLIEVKTRDVIIPFDKEAEKAIDAIRKNRLSGN